MTRSRCRSAISWTSIAATRSTFAIASRVCCRTGMQSVPGYSYVLGMHAFGLEEMNQYPEAEATALHALSIQPKDGWAVHAAVHVMEMQGRIDEGIAFLSSREARLGARQRVRVPQLLASRAVQHGRRAVRTGARALRSACASRSRRPISCRSSMPRRSCGGLQLEGVDVDDRFERVADDWEARLESEAGFYAFNDVHAAIAFAATGREAALSRARWRACVRQLPRRTRTRR